MCRFNAIKRRQRCNQNISSRARLKGKWLTKNFKEQIIVMLHNIFVKQKYMCYIVRIVKEAPRSWSEEAMIRTSLRTEERHKTRKKETMAWNENLRQGNTPNTLLSLIGNTFLFLTGLLYKPYSAWGIAQPDSGTTNGKRQKLQKRKPRQVGTTPIGAGPLSHLQGLWSAA